MNPAHKPESQSILQPVLILQHMLDDHPAYLATWLQARGIAFDLRNTALGQDFPADLSAHSALASLGGVMSANDDLPSLRQAEHLMREAARTGKPMLGHCLGGQLMAKALGGRVVASPLPEVGWQPMQIDNTPLAQAWLGVESPPHASRHQATVFHWHYEAFELPPGAQLLARSAACPHQAFAIGPHSLAMQFHVEVDAPKLAQWAAALDAEYQRAHRQNPGTVQSAAQMQERAATRLAAQQHLADRIYARWWAGVATWACCAAAP
jgi:GMP synthase (glutamine-hydrolysing)